MAATTTGTPITVRTIRRTGSPHADQVRALYREAGLDLDADLATLTRDADVGADPRPWPT